MSQITGGVVEYERLVKTGDYENKKLKVTLTFAIDEGDNNSNLDEVARNRAILLVEQGLHMKPSLIVEKTIPVAQPEEGRSAKIAAANAAEKVIPGPLVPHGFPEKAGEMSTPPKKARKAPPLTEDVVEAKGWPEGQVNGGQDRTLKQQLEASVEATAPASKHIDPSSMVFPGDSRAASTADLMTGAVPSHGIDRTHQAEGDFPGDEPVKEISAAVLTAACGAAANRVPADKVRKLRASYLPAGSEQKVSLIPGEKRAAFLAELEALA